VSRSPMVVVLCAFCLLVGVSGQGELRGRGKSGRAKPGRPPAASSRWSAGSAGVTAPGAGEELDRGSTAPANTITVVDAAPDSGWESSIAIGRDGLPIVAYLDLDGDRLKVVHCGDEACAAGNAVAVVDGSSCIAEATSVAIGDDGLPVISGCGANGSLTVAHCGTPTCEAGSLGRIRRHVPPLPR